MRPLRLITSMICLAPAFAARTGAPPGFVTTSGPEFQLDGKPFAFVGTNSYWAPLLTSQRDVESTFQQMNKAGVKVLRTWGFNAINGSELAGALESGLTYYQVWNSSEWVLNDGPQGLQRFDHVVETAEKHNIKLIVTFTNNWVGYGGSDLYIQWIVGSNVTHDVFFSDSRIIASYQRYVKTIVERYKDSPAIFAWELMNEARCLSDTFPGGSACAPGSELITKWYKQQSDFVRGLDPFHMITTGGEGQFTWLNNSALASDYNFNGQAGEDFDRDFLLENIDFVTYHLYPESWYPEALIPGSGFDTEEWGLEWITNHSLAAKQGNKPVVLEEFGVTNKTAIYPGWVQRALDTKHAGIMPWQFGALGLTEDGGNRVIKYADQILNGASPNDGLAIYENNTAVWDIFTHAAQVQNSRSG